MSLQAAPEASTSAANLPPPMHQSAAGRASSRHWKADAPPTVRSRLSPAIAKSFALRSQERTKKDAMKAVEKEMKEEVESVRRTKTEKIKERRDRLKEKSRLEELAAKMSVKKMMRLKKRLGRTKKVNA